VHSPSSQNDSQTPANTVGKGTVVALKSDQADDLVRCIAELSEAGLPLSDGLTAFAEDIPQSKVRRAMLVVANEIESGANPLVDPQSSDVQLPAFHREILVAGIRSGRLSETLLELLEADAWRREYRRDLWSAISQQAFLFVILLLVVDFFNVLLIPYLNKQFLEIYEDFSLELGYNPEILRTVGVSWIGLLTLGGIGWVTLTAALSVQQASQLRRSIPIFGKMIWWYDALDLVTKLRLLISQGIPTHRAMSMMTDAVSSRTYSELAPQWSARLERGESLSSIWRDGIEMPASILPLIRWGETHNELPEAFGAIEAALKQRLLTRQDILRKVLPPLMTVVVLTVLAWAAVRLIYLFVPMVKLLQWLS